jgi:hypothetical protein
VRAAGVLAGVYLSVTVNKELSTLLRAAGVLAGVYISFTVNKELSTLVLCVPQASQMVYT